MPRLTTAQRNQAIGMLHAGDSTREVAAFFNCHQSTIVRLNQRFRQFGTVDDRHGRGRQRVTTDAEDR